MYPSGVTRHLFEGTILSVRLLRTSNLEMLLPCAMCSAKRSYDLIHGIHPQCCYLSIYVIFGDCIMYYDFQGYIIAGGCSLLCGIKADFQTRDGNTRTDALACLCTDSREGTVVFI